MDIMIKRFLNYFQEHDCKLTQEILELIDREAELLMRGVKESNLEGLRKRISTLFLQYIKTPTFNPEAARLLKVIVINYCTRNHVYNLININIREDIFRIICVLCNLKKLIIIPSTSKRMQVRKKNILEESIFLIISRYSNYLESF